MFVREDLRARGREWSGSLALLLASAFFAALAVLWGAFALSAHLLTLRGWNATTVASLIGGASLAVALVLTAFAWRRASLRGKEALSHEALELQRTGAEFTLALKADMDPRERLRANAAAAVACSLALGMFLGWRSGMASDAGEI